MYQREWCYRILDCVSCTLRSTTTVSVLAYGLRTIQFRRFFILEWITGLGRRRAIRALFCRMCAFGLGASLMLQPLEEWREGVKKNLTAPTSAAALPLLHAISTNVTDPQRCSQQKPHTKSLYTHKLDTINCSRLDGLVDSMPFTPPYTHAKSAIFALAPDLLKFQQIRVRHAMLAAGG